MKTFIDPYARKQISLHARDVDALLDGAQICGLQQRIRRNSHFGLHPGAEEVAVLRRLSELRTAARLSAQLAKLERYLRRRALQD